MKIAIAANSQDPNAAVCMHAARAPYYLIYDDGALLDVISNPYCSVERGAAPRAAELLREQGVESLVAGEFGDRFIAKLEEQNITPLQGVGLVSKMIQEALI